MKSAVVTGSGITEADRQYMKQALALARRGLGKTEPNPAVGCVIVKDSKVIPFLTAIVCLTSAVLHRPLPIRQWFSLRAIWCAGDWRGISSQSRGAACRGLCPPGCR